MKVNDVFLELSEKDNKLGIYQELIAHLDSFLEEGPDGNPAREMPQFRSTENMVDLGYIEEICEELKAKQAQLELERSQILEWKVEVPDGEGDD